MIMLLNSRIVMLKLWQLEFRQLDIRGQDGIDLP